MENHWEFPNLGPAPLQKCVGDFCCIKFGGFCRGFSWRIFLGTFSHKNEEKKSGEKIREKIRRPKNENPRKISSAKKTALTNLVVSNLVVCYFYADSEALFCTLLGPFALFCALLRALFCMRSFALFCVFLRTTVFRTTAFGNCRNHQTFGVGVDSGS